MDTNPPPKMSEQSEEAKKPEQIADAECLLNSDDEWSSQPKEPVFETPSDNVPCKLPLSTKEPMERVQKSRLDQPEKRKRKHSPSPSSDGYQSDAHHESPAKTLKQDYEPSYDQDSVILSWYDSDLNLDINKENFVSAVPLADQGLMYMWGGARSTYGFNSGKVYYDVKLLEKSPVNMNDEFEIYSFRLGWSVAYSSLQLGETSLSYGYDSSGKKCTNDTFEEYGQSFSTEDVIGCLLDFETNEENVLISFAFNGTKQEVAFEVPKTSLEDKALFPHILSKNIGFEVNFGDRIEAWNSNESYRDNFQWAAKVPLERRIQGPKEPEEKTECEVTMMCGLPCSGKTTWVKNHVETHPEKMYNVIGIDFALNKMKILGEPIQNYYKDAPEQLIEKCNQCVNRLTELASVRWRNYIIDEPNVFAAIRRRKMRDFEGYTRTAIVIIPNEDEYDEMLEKSKDNALRDTSIKLIELKENFKLPEEGKLFNNVSFVGVNKEEAEEIVKKYNKEGRDASPADNWLNYNIRFRGRYHLDSWPMGDFRQNKPVITTNVPTLKKIASVTLAVSTIFNTSPEKLPNEKIIEIFRGTLKKSCFMYVIDLCLEMTKNCDRWIFYLRERFDQLDENAFAFDLLENVVWHQDGAINFLRSVTNLLASDKLSDMEKFRLACTYCLEKEIEIFWTSIQNEVHDLEILFQTHPLIGYWCYHCAGELDMVHINEPMTVDEFMIRNIADNWPAIEYFFERLHPKTQATVALRFIENDKKRKFQKSVLLKLNQDQRSYVYANRILKIMSNFFCCDHVDINIPDIVSIWHEARASITKHEFALLIELFGKYDTSGVILKEIWTSADEEFKNYVLNLYDYDFIGVLLQKAYHIDSLGFDFLFVVLADASKLDDKPHIAERIKFFDRLYEKMMVKNK